MAPKSDFASQSFDCFSADKELQNNKLGTDVNYNLDRISSINTKYYVPGEVNDQLKNL